MNLFVLFKYSQYFNPSPCISVHLVKLRLYQCTTQLLNMVIDITDIVAVPSPVVIVALKWAKLGGKQMLRSLPQPTSIHRVFLHNIQRVISHVMWCTCAHSPNMSLHSLWLAQRIIPSSEAKSWGRTISLLLPWAHLQLFFQQSVKHLCSRYM